MEIRKPFGLIILLAIVAHSLAAQQQYKLNDYGGPGTLYLYNRVAPTPPIEDINKGGPDQIWDLSAAVELNSHPNSIVTPGQVIDLFTFNAMCSFGGHNLFTCATIWASTEQTLLLQDTISLPFFEFAGLQRFQNKTPGYLLENFLGFTIDFGGVPTQAAVVYNSPDTILQFPLTYGDAWESNISWMIDLNNIGQNFIYESQQQKVVTVDAWGTLFTPFDTFTNVVRVRSEIRHNDMITTDSFSLPIDITELEYAWYDTSFKLPVMVARGVRVDTFEIINAVEYLFERTCATPAWTVELDTNVFTLDTTGEVHINFNIVNGNADSYVWNFDDGIIDVTSGTVSHTYFDDREYLVSVTGCMEDCLPLNSCTTQIVEFTIEDITSVDIVPASSLGIVVFPNPADNILVVNIPEELGQQLYQVTDMTGRIMQTGIFFNGRSPLAVHLWPTGIYAIQLWNKNYDQVAIVRFTIR